MSTLHLLSAGAAQGLVKSLEADFGAATGATLQARFGAVGAMKDALLAGAPCDLIVVTGAMIETLLAEGHVRPGSTGVLGRVRTGVAVRRGDAVPDAGSPDGLKAALLAAEAIYFPDPTKATAGIHFAKVMRELGVFDTLQPRLRTFPNGATAMRALADDPGPRHIGCTQVTEINYTDGVQLVGALPARFELATVYSAAVTTQAAQPELAARFIERLTGAGSQALRRACGFEL